MKTLTDSELQARAGHYFAPKGLYQYTKSLPFLGTLSCNRDSLTAGEWTEIKVEYTVGASGLADGAWIKGTFKFYSDWALFQSSDPKQDNYISAEYQAGPLHPGQEPATVQGLSVRFDQKGHERPFQKAIIVDIIDGYLNPGDKIIIRMGDRRWGAKGTRVQTFVENAFLMRWYIDPVGSSRFAPIQPDLRLPIRSGPVAKVKAITPRVVRPGVQFPVHVHTEDQWGNTTTDLANHGFLLELRKDDAAAGDPTNYTAAAALWSRTADFPNKGWTTESIDISLSEEGDYTLDITVLCREEERNNKTSTPPTNFPSSNIPLTATSNLPVSRPYFADLHVHSDDTVGTNDSTYNFSYARRIAGLDIVGYTANDFNITAEAWDKTLSLIHSINTESSSAKKEFLIFPGTEWCGNSAAGGDHNVVFLNPKRTPNSPASSSPSKLSVEFPLDRHGNVARSFEWNEHGPQTLEPGCWPLDELYATYAADGKEEDHLLIPHVGGRRCNLAWHHPGLERLLEIGSSWGQFEWLLRDAVGEKGWKMGVCANSDEHRGRCGGGVPGTAVFGVKGGLTGVLLLVGEGDRDGGNEKDSGGGEFGARNVGRALRARRTWATTGERLVGVVEAEVMGISEGQEKGGRKVVVQGDEVVVGIGEEEDNITLNYQFYGENGFESIETWGRKGVIEQRSLLSEVVNGNNKAEVQRKLRVKWGGARLYDRYREAVWEGSILIEDQTAPRIAFVKPFGGVADNPEDKVELVSDNHVIFRTRTSGDFDGVDIFFEATAGSAGRLPEHVSVTGSLGGYVKVGDPLAGNPHKKQPTFAIDASHVECSRQGGKRLEICGGAGLFVTIETLLDAELPKRVQGTVSLPASSYSEPQEEAVYLVGREWNGGKIITSPIFITYK